LACARRSRPPLVVREAVLRPFAERQRAAHDRVVVEADQLVWFVDAGVMRGEGAGAEDQPVLGVVDREGLGDVVDGVAQAPLALWRRST